MPDEQKAEQNATGSRLEQLAQKYNYDLTEKKRERVYRTFDTASSRDTLSKVKLGQTPGVESEGTGIGAVHAEMAGIQLELAKLAREYGELNVNFGTLIGKDKRYTLSDVIMMGVYSIPVLGNKNKIEEIHLNAIKRRGDALEYLVNAMANVINDSHQKTIEGRDQAKTIQIKVISHMKTLDTKLIESLRKGLYSGFDQAQADQEVSKLEAELNEIDDTIISYEKDLNTAKAAGDLEKANKLTDEMSKVLNIKRGVLDGKMSAEGVVSEIRRTMLDSAEGVQSAKGAMAASRVNYMAVSALIDSMNELEIKYRNAKQDMIPVFQQQAEISVGGLRGLGLTDTITKTAAISQRLMKANSDLVMCLAAETFKLLQKPLYDPEEARKTEEKIRSYMKQLNEQKKAWAENQQTLQNIETPHYAQRQ